MLSRCVETANAPAAGQGRAIGKCGACTTAKEPRQYCNSKTQRGPCLRGSALGSPGARGGGDERSDFTTGNVRSANMPTRMRGKEEQGPLGEDAAVVFFLQSGGSMLHLRQRFRRARDRRSRPHVARADACFVSLVCVFFCRTLSSRACTSAIYHSEHQTNCMPRPHAIGQ